MQDESSNFRSTARPDSDTASGQEMATAKDQTLPSKEASLFRQVVKFYESKQYKKGIKAADQVGSEMTSMSKYLLDHLNDAKMFGTAINEILMLWFPNFVDEILIACLSVCVADPEKVPRAWRDSGNEGADHWLPRKGRGKS